jgi:GntR family transcriptional regulator
VSEQIPKYRAIVGHYRSRVTSGELEAGTVLESRRKLAKTHKVARATIDKVVELLTAEGILKPSDGNRPPIVADISGRISTVQNRVENSAVTGRALAKNETSRIISVEAIPSPADVAPLLGVQTGDEVICRTRVNLIDDKPMATGYSYYPPEVTNVTPELRRPVSIPKPGSRELAAERMHSRQETVITKITSRLASDRERELLNLGGTMTVVTQQTRQVVLANGKTVEVAVKVTEGNMPVTFTSNL